MSSTVSVRISPMSRRKAGGQRRHDLRDPAHIPAYVDKDKQADNSVLLTAPEPAALRSEIAANRAAAGQQKLRDDARIAYSGIITWGTEAQAVIQAMPKAELSPSSTTQSPGNEGDPTESPAVAWMVGGKPESVPACR